MADQHARIVDPNYVFAGRRIRKGQLVQVTEQQLKDATKDSPPRMTAAEKKDYDTVVDLRPSAVKGVPEVGEPPKRPSLKDLPPAQQ